MGSKRPVMLEISCSAQTWIHRTLVTILYLCKILIISTEERNWGSMLVIGLRKHGQYFPYENIVWIQQSKYRNHAWITIMLDRSGRLWYGPYFTGSCRQEVIHGACVRQAVWHQALDTRHKGSQGGLEIHLLTDASTSSGYGTRRSKMHYACLGNTY